MNPNLVRILLIFFVLHKSFFAILDAIDQTKGTVANAKIFRQQFILKASRIACQILIKEDQLLHLTHIACVTHIMIERM